MTFEEFFTKKRIDLSALKSAEPGLFSEFKSQFEQMGEKSFDYTKKYCFNKLRHQYHLAPEQKPEKAQISNLPAEQTIIEIPSKTLEAPKPPPKVGFVPRFKAAKLAKPVSANDNKTEANPVSPDLPAGTTELPKDAPKTGITPKFRAAAPPGLPEDDKKETEQTVEEKPAESTEAAAQKPAYKPRFNIKNMPPKKEE